MTHLYVKVFGQVRGVFFRHSAKMKAEELQVSGFIHNEESDMVYIEAEGEENALQDFLTWCRTGPPMATVERVEYGWSDTLKNFAGFEIK